MKSIYYLFLGFLSLISCLPSNLPKPAEELQKPEPQQIHLQGKTQLGQTLSIAGLPKLPYGYARQVAWYRDGSPISRAKDQLTYTLTPADVGKRIKVGVQFLWDGHPTQTFESGYGPYVTSDPTEEVADEHHAPSLDEKPIILGAPYVGETLRVQRFKAATPKGYRIEYAWQRSGATFLKTYQRKYTLTSVDLGKRITVKARYVKFPNYITYKYPVGNPRTDGQVKYSYDRYGEAYNVLHYQFSIDPVQAAEFDISYKITIRRGTHVLRHLTEKRAKGQHDDGYYIRLTPSYLGIYHTSYAHWKQYSKGVEYSWQVELTIDGETTTSPKTLFKRED